MVTEVNVNVATLVGFDAITNALVEARPSRAADEPAGERAPARPPAGPLETSFDVHMTLGKALEQLHAAQQFASGQQTPALGKCCAWIRLFVLAHARPDHNCARSCRPAACGPCASWRQRLGARSNQMNLADPAGRLAPARSLGRRPVARQMLISAQ